MVTALIVAAAVWIGIGIGVGVALAWSAWHDKTWEVERPEWADDATPTFDALCFEFWEKEVQP